MTPRDDGESIGLFEPLIVSEGAKSRTKLNDLSKSLAEKSLALSSSMAPALGDELALIVAIANSHYSNRIEGHDIHPIDIERAMQGERIDNSGTRSLAMEANAHIAVQRWMDESAMGSPPFSKDRICEIHKRFYEGLPEEFLQVRADDDGGRAMMEPGVTRSLDVKIGRHIAVSPGAVARFLRRLEQAYRSTNPTDQIVIAACGHHRLLWIHPFLDGNGRVARLVSHGAISSAIGTTSMWSLSRGLARREREYRSHLAACDEPRRGSLDGRGSLSEGALALFAEFFLETCIEEVDFVRALMRPDTLMNAVQAWTHQEIRRGELPDGCQNVVEAVLRRVEMPVSDLQLCTEPAGLSVLYLTEALSKRGIIRFDASKSTFRLAFPVQLASSILPDLVPTSAS